LFSLSVCLTHCGWYSIYSITRWLAEKDLIDKVRIYEFMEKEITERSVDEMGEVHLKNISEALDILYWR